MRCIFCKADSAGSRSKEHIIPESLGNSFHVLPQGIVCDKCNNYFSREVERPFLESGPVRCLRFDQSLVSKRGKIPPIAGVIAPVMVPAVMTKFASGSIVGRLSVPEQAAPALLQQPSGQMLFFATPEQLPEKAVSRFLAKIAIEAMAWRLLRMPHELSQFVDESQLDQIRNHARRGETPIWPYHRRSIYDMNKQWTDSSGQITQVLHEFDVLATPWGEWFFVLAIFGVEFAINYGGPEIAGYLRWLDENENKSPLYSGTNSDSK
jgi:hypothetical protein